MRLFATPLSHFSRKVRLLLDHHGLAYHVVDIGNVASNAEQFNGNPLMKVPVLVDDDVWLIDSDHIAAHIVRTHAADDRYRVLTTESRALNARAVLNGVMENEVKVLLAERTGLETTPHAYFRKARAAIEKGLAWLDGQADIFSPEAPGYLDFHLVCALDHLAYYETVSLKGYTALARIVDAVSASQTVRQTAPDVLKPR